MPEPFDQRPNISESQETEGAPHDLALAWIFAIVGGLMLFGLIVLACVSLPTMLHHR